MDLQVVATPFEFVEEGGVFVGGRGATVGNAATQIGGTMLADVLIGRAITAVVIGWNLGKEGKDNALTIHAKDDDGGFHCLVL
jgi:hypothetical protein